MNEPCILAIDQGTSGSKAVIFTPAGEILSKETVPLVSTYPRPGFVEQDPEEIYAGVLEAVRKTVDSFRAAGGDPSRLAACGISNQRETALLFDKEGRSLRPAMVWQCKRSVETCARLEAEGAAEELNRRTGLIIDPYFSGTKLSWIMEHEPETAARIRRGEALFGTVDTWLVYRLTRGAVYASDYTNASRTLLMNLSDLAWDEAMISMLGVEGIQLPELRSSSAGYGETDFEGILPRPVPITAVVGDSHAAAFGERCFAPGEAKATLGTGSSILMNTGGERKHSARGMVSTVCWSAGSRVDYALEGIIVSCGSTITWLRDQLGLFAESGETEGLARSVDDNGGVYLIPAFSGLGAPHWKPAAKGSIVGLTFASAKDHLVRAGLESVIFQIKDVIAAMEADSGIRLSALKLDGGLTANRFVLEGIASLLDTTASAIQLTEASALGAAFLAGLGSGVYKSIEEIGKIAYTSDDYRPATDETLESAYREWQTIVRNA